MSALTAERVRELLDYDPATGVFTWKPRKPSDFTDGALHKAVTVCRRWNTRYAGKNAGCRRDNDGYIQIHIINRRYLAHRLTWLWLHGKWLPDEIDHISGERDDNRIANLRPATSSQNKQNSPTQANNTSGTRGVAWRKEKRRWEVYLNSNGRRIRLGHYTTKNEAAVRRSDAEKKYFGEFVRAS